jgi:uncharacterized integral membrane protein (TIGR00698 family)
MLLALNAASPFLRLLPGLGLATAVAAVATVLHEVIRAGTGGAFALPGMVIALLIGMALSSFAARPGFEPGLTFAVKKLLRWAIALLGLRVALADIVGLGPGVITLVIAAMAATIVAAGFLARRLGTGIGYGMLAGAATAVCGASATLATATVVPAYPAKSSDIAFTVVAANAVSTLVMLAYPALAGLLGLSDVKTGILLGATIHDMAQVVGAGYAISEPVGNAAVVVKLFRVFLLLPVVLAIGWWFVRVGGEAGAAKVPMPVFALVFLALVVLNSAAPAVPMLAPTYSALQPWLVQASSVGLLLAIAALGLGTSVRTVLAIGWGHAGVFAGTTLVILLVIVGGLGIL